MICHCRHLCADDLARPGQAASGIVCHHSQSDWHIVIPQKLTYAVTNTIAGQVERFERWQRLCASSDIPELYQHVGVADQREYSGVVIRNCQPHGLSFLHQPLHFVADVFELFHAVLLT